jgi:sensor domain CHASE-containing protein
MNKPIINNTFETTAGTETVDLRKKEEHKRLNIHTFMAHENEVCFGGTDEHGEELCVWFDAYEFIDWCDIDYIKEKLTKYINEK